MGTAPTASRSERAVWALLLASSALYFFTINEADNDLWGHILFGREMVAAGLIPRVATHTYTAVGQPWVNHEWLSQVILAAVYEAAASPGLLLFKFTLAAATFLLLFGGMRARSQSVSAWGLTGLLSIAVLARGFAVRPQIFTYCGIALILTVLDYYQRGRRHSLWFVPLLFVLWTNLHGGFVLGLVILGLFAASEMIRLRTVAVGPLFALLGAAGVTVLNPYGLRLLTYVWHELTRAHPISEWQPAAVSPSQFAFFAMLLLFAATVPFTRRAREHGWQLIVVVASAWLALRHARHTPVFALCAAAPLAAQLDHAGRWLRGRAAFQLHGVSRRVIAAGMLALATVQLGFTASRWRRDGLQIVYAPADYPVEAVRALQQVPSVTVPSVTVPSVTVGAPFNLAVPLDWGEYVLWFLAPHAQVSLDGRFATLFPEAVVTDNFNFFSGMAGWRRLVDAYPTDAALVPVGSPCLIGTLPDWHIVFRSSVALVYARAGSPVWPELQRLAPNRLAPAGSFP